MDEMEKKGKKPKNTFFENLSNQAGRLGTLDSEFGTEAEVKKVNPEQRSDEIKAQNVDYDIEHMKKKHY